MRVSFYILVGIIALVCLGSDAVKATKKTGRKNKGKKGKANKKKGKKNSVDTTGMRVTAGKKGTNGKKGKKASQSKVAEEVATTEPVDWSIACEADIVLLCGDASTPTEALACIEQQPIEAWSTDCRKAINSANDEATQDRDAILEWKQQQVTDACPELAGCDFPLDPKLTNIGEFAECMYALGAEVSRECDAQIGPIMWNYDQAMRQQIDEIKVTYESFLPVADSCPVAAECFPDSTEITYNDLFAFRDCIAAGSISKGCITALTDYQLRNIMLDEALSLLSTFSPLTEDCPAVSACLPDESSGESQSAFEESLLEFMDCFSKVKPTTECTDAVQEQFINQMGEKQQEALAQTAMDTLEVIKYNIEVCPGFSQCLLDTPEPSQRELIGFLECYESELYSGRISGDCIEALLTPPAEPDAEPEIQGGPAQRGRV